MTPTRVLATGLALGLAIGPLAACGSPPRARATTGAIAGLARDRASGDPVAKAAIRVRAETSASELATTSGERGRYDIARLAPGRYRLSAAFAGQPVEVVNIDVRAGETTTVDLVFTLGSAEPIRVDFASARSRPRAYLNQNRAPMEKSNQNPTSSR